MIKQKLLSLQFISILLEIAQPTRTMEHKKIQDEKLKFHGCHHLIETVEVHCYSKKKDYFELINYK